MYKTKPSYSDAIAQLGASDIQSAIEALDTRLDGIDKPVAEFILDQGIQISYIHLDLNNGVDSNSGFDPLSPIKTFTKLQQILDKFKFKNDRVIVVLKGSVTSGSYSLTGEKFAFQEIRIRASADIGVTFAGTSSLAFRNCRNTSILIADLNFLTKYGGGSLVFDNNSNLSVLNCLKFQTDSTSLSSFLSFRNNVNAASSTNRIVIDDVDSVFTRIDTAGLDFTTKFLVIRNCQKNVPTIRFAAAKSTTLVGSPSVYAALFNTLAVEFTGSIQTITGKGLEARQDCRSITGADRIQATTQDVSDVTFTDGQTIYSAVDRRTITAPMSLESNSIRNLDYTLSALSDLFLPTTNLNYFYRFRIYNNIASNSSLTLKTGTTTLVAIQPGQTAIAENSGTTTWRVTIEANYLQVESQRLIENGAINLQSIYPSPIANTLRLSWAGGQFKFANRGTQNLVILTAIATLSYSLYNPDGGLISTANQDFNFNRYWSNNAIATTGNPNFATIQFLYLKYDGTFHLVLGQYEYSSLTWAIAAGEKAEIKKLPSILNNSDYLYLCAIAGKANSSNIAANNPESGQVCILPAG